MDKNQRIKCEVQSCKFQDKTNNYCDLSEIEVGCDCNKKEAKNIGATICKSFEYDFQKSKK